MNKIDAPAVPSLELNGVVEAVLSRAYEAKEDAEDYSALLPDILRWLATPPMYTTLRINTISTTLHAAKDAVDQQLKKQCAERGTQPFTVGIHHHLPDCLVVNSTGPHLPAHQPDMEVIVDKACGMAVLRGADIFRQGILGAPTVMKAGSRVRVMADLDSKCLRGMTQPYQGKKLYVGTGTAQVSREDLFCNGSATLRGVGIKMTEPLYQAPSLSEMLPNIVFAQNLPSIVCGHVLNPQPGQVILDMCAAPGGKTCHLAVLMKDQGRVVALDKTIDRVGKVKGNAGHFGLTCIETYAFDARNAMSENAEMSGGPPYPSCSFDAVLLDAPCSALGQRPSVRNTITPKSLASFPRLQQMLLSTAVSLVRPGGLLVYSTCTITLEENEDQVAWVLRTFPDLHLETQIPHLGGIGLSTSTLSLEERRLVQRFHPTKPVARAQDMCDTDTIGFFIAKFRKKS